MLPALQHFHFYMKCSFLCNVRICVYMSFFSLKVFSLTISFTFIIRREETMTALFYLIKSNGCLISLLFSSFIVLISPRITVSRSVSQWSLLPSFQDQDLTFTHSPSFRRRRRS